MSRGSHISMMYNTSTYMYIHTEDVVYISEHIPQNSRSPGKVLRGLDWFIQV